METRFLAVDPGSSKLITRDSVMSEILPVFVLPLATIAIAYILELMGFAAGQFSSLVNGLPNWTGTAVLLGLVVATYRYLRE